MKKILFLFIGFLVTNLLIGQNKSGAIPTETWSGTITVIGTVTVGDGIVLTIDAGTTILFDSGTSLVIQGTGVIHANGTSGSKITFTRNGPSAIWQHIRFLSSASGSNLIYCEISYGYGSDFQAIGVQGGGLYIGGSGLTVDNCEIFNCTGEIGGGIEIENSSPVIKNCKIHNNTNEGIDVYLGSPQISDCVIYKNSSPNGAGGINVLESDPNILNCTITENVTSKFRGYGGITISSSYSPHVVNTIFWNNKRSTSTGFDLGGNASITNCAFVQAVSGQLLLSSNNGDATGPNFTNPSADNYSIIFISPCRDAGAITTPTIPNDIIGNPRIGPYDIGAYEVQYSRWKGVSTSWTAITNWEANLAPSSTSKIILPGGFSVYPTLLSFTIAPTGILTIDPGATVQISSLVNNGQLILKSNDLLTSSLIAYSYSGTGQTKVDLFLKGGVSASGPRWHWITSPFSVSKTLFTTNPTNNNLLKYVESKVLSAINDGWNWHDTYYGSTPFLTVDPWVGYNVYYTADHTYTFDGTTIEVPGITPKIIPLNFSGGDINLFGWNLIGNSYLCGINWDLMGRDASVNDAVYYSINNIVSSYVAGVSTNGGSNIIPPLQAFFVKTDAASQTISVDFSAAIQSTAPRFKGLIISDIQLVRVNISKDDLLDESVIRFKDDASDNFDNKYDAVKFLSESANMPQIYTQLYDKKYSINSVPFPKVETIVPVVVRIPVIGEYKINCTEFTGLENYRVTLKDIFTQQIIDLSKIKTYTFNSESAGLISNRFVITIINITTDISLPHSIDKQFNIYIQQGIINVIPMQDQWDGKTGAIKIIDISGKIVADRIGTIFNKGVPELFSLNLTNGIYIINITSGNKKYVGKVSILN